MSVPREVPGGTGEEGTLARPRAADYEDREQRILDTAARLFAERGYAAVSISNLAAACKASKALLYHYYSSKDDVLFALLLQHIRRLHDGVQSVLDEAGSREDRLERLAERLLDLFDRYEAQHRVLVNDRRALAPKRRAEIDRIEGAAITRVTELLESINPRLRNQEAARRLAVVLWMGMLNWTALNYDFHGTEPPSSLFKGVTDIFLNGLTRFTP